MRNYRNGTLLQWQRLLTIQWTTAATTTVHQIRYNGQLLTLPVNVHRCPTFRWRRANVTSSNSRRPKVFVHHTVPKVFYAILVHRQSHRYQIGMNHFAFFSLWKLIWNCFFLVCIEAAIRRLCRRNGEVNRIIWSIMELIRRCWHADLIGKFYTNMRLHNKDVFLRSAPNY